MSILKYIVVATFLLYLFTLHHSYSADTYTPESLSKFVPNSNKINLIDPKSYLRSYEKIEEMSKLVLEIKNSKNLDIFIYFIPEIARNFGSKGDKNIELFLNDLSFLVFRGDTKMDNNSIFILYSINDRQSRIRTGAKVGEYLQDTKLSQYQDEIKSYLKDGNYDTALLELIQKIHKRVLTNNQFLSDLYESITNLLKILFLIIVIVIIIAFIDQFYTKIGSTAEQKLKKIKEITETQKNQIKFIETTCIICLDALKKAENDLPTLEEINEHNGGQTDSVPEIELNNRNCIINSEEANKINSERERENEKTSKDDFIAKLECGHQFHSKCIAEWMTKQNKCPICREKIEKEEEEKDSDEKENSNTNANTNTRSFTRSLINIQNNIHPEFSLLDFTYSENSVTWKYKSTPKSSTENSSSYSSSWGSSSKGSSSKW